MSKIKEDVVRELHTQARKNFLRRKVDIRDKDECWQADLVDMIEHAQVNSGYKYILTVIDNFSKFSWAIGLKSKTGKEVSAAMEKIFKQGRVCKNLHVDQGTEFYNAIFKKMLKKYNVHLYSTYTHLKASIIERFNRTIKNKMWFKFSLQGSYKWIKILQELIEEYNNTKHRTIKMRPCDVVGQNIEILKQTVYDNLNYCHVKPKFNVNDNVRISKYKHIFEKGYKPNWTNEIFTIIKINKTAPVTYKLKDYQENPIQGCFYNEELQRVKHSDIYLIEKVIKKWGDKIYVKYLGFDNSHNEWSNKKAIQ